MMMIAEPNTFRRTDSNGFHRRKKALRLRDARKGYDRAAREVFRRNGRVVREYAKNLRPHCKGGDSNVGNRGTGNFLHARGVSSHNRSLRFAPAAYGKKS